MFPNQPGYPPGFDPGGGDGGLWDGLEDAPTFDQGNWFNAAGGNFVVRIDRVLTKKSKKSGHLYMVECTVLESDQPADPVGCARTWSQSLKSDAIAFPNIKGFIHAVLGLDKKDPADAAKIPAVDKVIKRINAMAYGPGNAFRSVVIRLNTIPHIKEDGGPFTIHKWIPLDDQELAVRGLAPVLNLDTIMAQVGQPQPTGYGGGPPPWTLPPGGQKSPDGTQYWAPGMPGWTPIPR